ncbi:MAG TPA: hypothetical protein VGA96_09585, partial [Fibrella sp.]
NLVKQRPGFELAIEPECNIVCFRYVGQIDDPASLNTLNQRIRADLLADGRFYIVQTMLREHTYLRVSLMNPLTTEADLVELLEEIETASSAVDVSGLRKEPFSE